MCEDIWEPEPAAHAAEQGAELLIVINASPFDVQKSAQREELLAQRARENNVAIAYLNLIGGQDDLLFDGGSVLVEADGRIAARAPVFVDALLVAEYDSATRRFSADRLAGPNPIHRARRASTPDSCAASATTSTRTIFLACCSACPAASTRRWRLRSRSTRSARTT